MRSTISRIQISSKISDGLRWADTLASKTRVVPDRAQAVRPDALAGIVSFPRAGYTLTLDFPNKGKATLDMLAGLDRITVEAGGAVNPYKDARMSAQTFAARSRTGACWKRARSSLHVRFLGAHGAATAPCQPNPETSGGIDKIRSNLVKVFVKTAFTTVDISFTVFLGICTRTG